MLHKNTTLFKAMTLLLLTATAVPAELLGTSNGSEKTTEAQATIVVDKPKNDSGQKSVVAETTVNKAANAPAAAVSNVGQASEIRLQLSEKDMDIFKASKEGDAQKHLEDATVDTMLRNCFIAYVKQLRDAKKETTNAVADYLDIKGYKTGIFNTIKAGGNARCTKKNLLPFIRQIAENNSCDERCPDILKPELLNFAKTVVEQFKDCTAAPGKLPVGQQNTINTLTPKINAGSTNNNSQPPVTSSTIVPPTGGATPVAPNTGTTSTTPAGSNTEVPAVNPNTTTTEVLPAGTNPPVTTDTNVNSSVTAPTTVVPPVTNTDPKLSNKFVDFLCKNDTKPEELKAFVEAGILAEDVKDAEGKVKFKAGDALSKYLNSTDHTDTDKAAVQTQFNNLVEKFEKNGYKDGQVKSFLQKDKIAELDKVFEGTGKNLDEMVTTAYNEKLGAYCHYKTRGFSKGLSSPQKLAFFSIVTLAVLAVGGGAIYTGKVIAATVRLHKQGFGAFGKCLKEALKQVFASKDEAEIDADIIGA